MQTSDILNLTDLKALSPHQLLSRAGGKGAKLTVMAANSLIVPRFIIFSPDFLKGCYERHWGQALDPGCAELAERILACADEVNSELIASRVGFELGEGLKAVRSSAQDEDGALSFAGQLDSFLNVDPTDLPRRVFAVFASAFGKRVLAYRKLNRINTPPSLPAVIVQEMVMATSAGVIFSHDPVRGGSRPLVSMVEGLADGLVSGRQDGQNFLLDQASGLTASQVAQLQTAVTTLEELFAGPQDIEFAIDGSGLVHLVQARPITTSPETLRVFDGSNIQESYPGIVSPLTFSFIRRAYGEVYKSFLRMMGVSERVILGQGDLFSNMLAYVDGRVYYNLGSWYRLIALLPAYRTNRTFMEGMMGLKDSASELAEFSYPSKASLTDLLATFVSVLCISKNYLTLPVQIKDFNRRLDSALQPSTGETSLSALYRRYRNLEVNLLSHWQAPVSNDFFAMILFGLFSRLCGGQDGGNKGHLYNLLLHNHGGIISAEPPRRIAEMAAFIAAGNDDKLVHALIEKDLQTALRLLKSNEAAYHLYLEYLDKFADRAIGELKLEAHSLRDEPGLLLATIGNLARKIQSGELPQNAADRGVSDRGQAVKNTNPLLGLLARLARQSLAQRENLRFARTRVFGEVRGIVLAMAEHLVDMGVLAEKRDVFYLTIEELLGFVDGTAVSTNLAALVALRKAEAAKYLSDAPERLSIYGAVGLREACPAVVEECQLKGLGASAGKVRGPARVITDPDNETVAPGEILIADHTDPGWIVHFATCSAIVVAHGSQLSHTAIVAREMNLPAVVSCRGVMSRIKSGDLIEVDGSQGLITVLKDGTEPVSVINGEKVDVEATA